MSIEKNELIRKLKGDMIIVAVILTAALLSFIVPFFMNDKYAGKEVIILQNGQEIGRYDLSEDNTITIRGEADGYNLILISAGKVRVTDADCPDKLCIRQRSISRSGESIICLPHKLVIMIDSPEESDLDAVTN